MSARCTQASHAATWANRPKAGGGAAREACSNYQTMEIMLFLKQKSW